MIAQIKESLPPTERSQKHVLEKLKQTWMEMSAEAKDPWEKKAVADKERYRRELAEEKAARHPDKDELHCVIAAVDQYGFMGRQFHDMLKLLAFQVQANDAAQAHPSQLPPT